MSDEEPTVCSFCFNDQPVYVLHLSEPVTLTVQVPGTDALVEMQDQRPRFMCVLCEQAWRISPRTLAERTLGLIAEAVTQAQGAPEDHLRLEVLNEIERDYSKFRGEVKLLRVA